jgi:hypothetical protein
LPAFRDDPLFHQPYEPPEAPAATEAESEVLAAAAAAGGHGSRGSITGARRPRKTVAALLGGLVKR